jgi:hypothetical protein
MNIALEKEMAALVQFFNAAKIKYAVLGGIAVLLYGEPRLTMDIDVNISIDKSDIDKFLKVGRKYGFYAIPGNIRSFVKKTGVIPMKFCKGKITGKCDVIIAENPIEFSALERAVTKKIGLVKVRVITPEDLIIHKITSSRPRDIEDLEGIIVRQKGMLDIKYIKSWLKKIADANYKPGLIKLFEKLAGR